MSQPNTRLWSVGAVLLCAALLVASWFLLIGPKRAEAADLAAQKQSTDDSNAQLQAKIAQLKAQFADLPAKQAELADIQLQMPDNPALPSLVRDLDSIAVTTGVSLQSLAPGTPAVFKPAGATQTPAAASPAAATGSSPAGSSAQKPAAAGAPAVATELVAIPVNVVVTGDFFKAELFLKQVQAQMKRAYLVQNLQVATGASASGGTGSAATTAGDVTMTLTGDVFVLKGATADAGAVKPTTAPAAHG